MDKKQVLVIGGGIAGVQAALDLAQMGVRAILVEEQPSIGGRMAQLDKTFPTNDCSTCILSPKLVELADHPNVEMLAYSTLQEVVRTDDGGFRATVLRKARYVDAEKCTNCGLCTEKCPVKIPDPFNVGIAKTKCIGIPYAQAVPAAYTINRDHCLYLNEGKCGVCKKICPAGAIDYDQKDAVESFDVSAVIVAAGGEEYSPRIRPEYGHGLYPNVVTSMEYERLLSASGPTSGQVLRPSDGAHPQRIAFIQCVGSRDIANGERGYCSAYCCMQATKEAIVSWEHDRDVKASVFYIDIRAFGKDFDDFVTRAKDECGVRYIQSRISEIVENPKTKNLALKFAAPDGTVGEEEFDLVVLSVGIQVSPRVRELLSRFGVTTDPHGFCPSRSFDSGQTNAAGIYVCGTSAGPMDIPETVVSASSAAAAAARGLLTRDETKPSGEAVLEEEPIPEDMSPLDFDQSPRIGVFVCRCGINIGSVVDVPAVVKRAKVLPNVRCAEEMTYACSQNALRTIQERIKEHRLNRIVVASCSPRTHEKVFRGALKAAGLNEYLLQMANIRDHCSWVHRDEPEAATEKAAELVLMAVGKARMLAALETRESEVRKSCLVIGGGVAGMTAALTVAENGFPAYLLEREESLGGNALKMSRTLDTADLPTELEGLIASVKNHPLIEVYENARIEEVSGWIGKFDTRFTQDGEGKIIEHGTVIVATGAREHLPENSYGYGGDPCIVTQREFEHMMACRHPLLRSAQSVAMIQCVESREGGRPGCSRVCCGEAIKNSLRFRAEYPRKDIYVFYRDMRTYGLLESRYTEARKAGAVFIRFDAEKKPEVARNGQGDLAVSVFDSIVGKDVRIPAQIVVLSAGMDPEPENDRLAKMLKIPLDASGYFHEAHVKLRPVEFATDGVFLCGLAHGPKYLSEAAAQARAAASRALTVLTHDTVRSEANTACVDKNRCSGCGMCADVCAYRAIEVVEGAAVVNELMCKGCGACAAACLSGAIDLSGFTNKQIVKEFEELFVR